MACTVLVGGSANQTDICQDFGEVCSVISDFEACIRYRVKSGVDVNFWTDTWIRDKLPKRRFQQLLRIARRLGWLVADYMERSNYPSMDSQIQMKLSRLGIRRFSIFINSSQQYCGAER